MHYICERRNLKLVYSRYIDEESGLKKTRSESQEDDEVGLVRARYKVCYEAFVKCRGNIKDIIREFSSSTSKFKGVSGADSKFHHAA